MPAERRRFADGQGCQAQGARDDDQQAVVQRLLLHVGGAQRGEQRLHQVVGQRLEVIQDQDQVRAHCRRRRRSESRERLRWWPPSGSSAGTSQPVCSAIRCGGQVSQGGKELALRRGLQLVQVEVDAWPAQLVGEQRLHRLDHPRLARIAWAEEGAVAPFLDILDHLAGQVQVPPLDRWILKDRRQVDPVLLGCGGLGS